MQSFTLKSHCGISGWLGGTDCMASVGGWVVRTVWHQWVAGWYGLYGISGWLGGTDCMTSVGGWVVRTVWHQWVAGW